MRPLPRFDLYYPDGLALLDLTDHIDLDAAKQVSGPGHQTLIEKLIRAVDEMEHLKQGWRPAPEIIAAAPLLTGWIFSGGDSPGSATLTGIVTGHPGITSGSHHTTSILLAIDTGAWRCARTVSCFYQLGAAISEPTVGSPGD